jgi:hypothetical protein
VAQDITRYINPKVERELWARSAGRCQFSGCNILLYKSPVTQERVNISEKAHIYSFSEDGPRGWGPFVTNKKELNNIDNIMLMCPSCHKTIDKDKNGNKYSADLLQKWKQEHEHRVVTVTNIASNKKSYPVFYGSNIGEQKSPIQKMEALEAMFPGRYPAQDPILLSMFCSHEDNADEFWNTESKHLQRVFETNIVPLIDKNESVHFSLFALAPMPLLIQLGALFTDKIDVDVYQPIREPKTWKRQPYPKDFKFIANEPSDFDYPPVLVISLSDRITVDRIISVIGEQVSIWNLTVDEKFLHNDFLRSPKQLSMLRKEIRHLMGSIKQKHGHNTPLHIFPAMPVSCAIEIGRARMPKADMPWVIYDQNKKEKKFINALTIGA